jgi:hypothetical protein
MPPHFAGLFEKDYNEGMRVLIFIAALFTASAAFAGVEVKDGKISADITNLPLRQVLQTLKQNTKIHFSMDDEIAGLAVSASFQDLTVAAGIKKLLEGTGINYVVMADANGDATSIFLGKSEKAGGPPKKLDSRPVSNMPNRGVVQPVQPMQPIQQVQPQGQNRGPNNRQPQPNNNKPAGMGTTTEVPTGGTLVAPTPQMQPVTQDGESRANPDNNTNNNGDEDEEPDDE